VLEAVAGDQADHRAEDFLLRDAHLWCDIAKYGWLDEVAVLQVAAFHALAASQKPGAFGFADVDVAEVAVELLFVDGGAHFDAFVEAVANFDFQGALDEALHEFCVDVFVQNDAAGGGAALTGGAELLRVFFLAPDCIIRYSTQRDSVSRRFPSWCFTLRADCLRREEGDDFGAVACGRCLSFRAGAEQGTEDQSEYGAQGDYAFDRGWVAGDAARNWHSRYRPTRGADFRAN